MEYKAFEKIFMKAGFTEQQMKKIRNFSYKVYAENGGRKVSTGGHRQAAYNSFVRVCRVCSNVETLEAFMRGACKATTEQIDNLYNGLRSVA